MALLYRKEIKYTEDYKRVYLDEGFRDILRNSIIEDFGYDEEKAREITGTIQNEIYVASSKFDELDGYECSISTLKREKQKYKIRLVFKRDVTGEQIKTMMTRVYIYINDCEEPKIYVQPSIYLDV